MTRYIWYDISISLMIWYNMSWYYMIYLLYMFSSYNYNNKNNNITRTTMMMMIRCNTIWTIGTPIHMICIRIHMRIHVSSHTDIPTHGYDMIFSHTMGIHTPLYRISTHDMFYMYVSYGIIWYIIRSYDMASIFATIPHYDMIIYVLI